MERTYVIGQTSNQTLLDRLLSQMRDDPWTAFAEHPQKEFRLAILDMIGRGQIKPPPPEWVEAAVMGLGPFSDIGKRILAWHVENSPFDQREHALGLASRAARPLIGEARKDISALMAKRLRKLRGCVAIGEFNIGACDLYWDANGVRQFFKSSLHLLISAGDKESFTRGYTMVQWSIAMHAINQATAVADMTMVPILNEFAAKCERGEIGPHIGDGESGFLPVAAIDHVAIVRSRVSYIEKANAVAQWQGAFLKEIAAGCGVQNVEVTTETGGTAHAVGEEFDITITVTAPDSDDQAILESRLKKIEIMAWTEGMRTASPPPKKFVGNTWRMRASISHDVGRIWIGYKEGATYNADNTATLRMMYFTSPLSV